mmetsp:Transcript_107021/g.130548  ORF Transcript_107021/g.130548 Transcript_107021/m.130548 type:complete len:292 (+) Transcript_107021:129-1004(+)
MGICVTTHTKEIRVVERCGKYDRGLGPGCAILWLPCCWEQVRGTLSLKLQEFKVRCDTKTKDNVFVKFQVSVQYRVQNNKIREAFYKLTDPKRQMESYVFDVIRAAVPKKELDHVFTSKKEIGLAIQNELKETMTKFGYEIVSTPVTDIDPDPGVKDAMNEINKQERLKQAAKAQAEGRKIASIKDAQANAEKVRIEAQAESDAKQLSGQGLARQRQAIIDGLQESVKLFKESIKDADTSSVMDLILLTQYFDALKDVGLATSSTLFIPSNPSVVKKLADQMRQGILANNK